MKACSGCLEVKDESEFSPGKRNRGGLCPRCKSCVSEYNRKHYAKNPDHHRKRARDYARLHPENCRRNDRTPGRRLNRAKRSAGKRGISFEISLDEYMVVIGSGQCHYCGGNLDPSGGGMDRVDNSLGYSSGNVVPCCGRCNAMKGKYLTYEEMVIIWSRRLQSH